MRSPIGFGLAYPPPPELKTARDRRVAATKVALTDSAAPAAPVTVHVGVLPGPGGEPDRAVGAAGRLSGARGGRRRGPVRAAKCLNPPVERVGLCEPRRFKHHRKERGLDPLSRRRPKGFRTCAGAGEGERDGDLSVHPGPAGRRPR